MINMTGSNDIKGGDAAYLADILTGCVGDDKFKFYEQSWILDALANISLNIDYAGAAGLDQMTSTRKAFDRVRREILHRLLESKDQGLRSAAEMPDGIELDDLMRLSLDSPYSATDGCVDSHEEQIRALISAYQDLWLSPERPDDVRFGVVFILTEGLHNAVYGKFTDAPSYNARGRLFTRIAMELKCLELEYPSLLKEFNDRFLTPCLPGR